MSSKNVKNDPWQEAAAALPGLQAKAKLAGLPLTYVDLFAKKPLLPVDNAKDLIFEVGTKIDTLGNDPYNWASRVAYGPADKRAQTLKQIEESKPYFEALKRIAACRGLRFTESASTGEIDLLSPPNPGAPFDSYAKCKRAVRFCAMRAVVLAHIGKVADALASFDVGYKLSNAMSYEPGIMAGLVQSSEYAILDDAVLYVIPRLAKKPDELESLRDMVESRNKAVDSSWWIESEFTFNINELRKTAKRYIAAKAKPEEGALPFPKSVDYETGFKACEARLIEAYLTGLGDQGKYASFQLFSQHFQDGIDKALKGEDPTYKVLKSWSGLYPGVFKSIILLDARRNVLLATIEVAKFEAKHGRLPASLSKANINHADPMSSGPLSYRIDKGVAIIYSYGRNMLDDGGTSDSNLDIVMHYPASIPQSKEYKYSFTSPKGASGDKVK